MTNSMRPSTIRLVALALLAAATLLFAVGAAVERASGPAPTPGAPASESSNHVEGSGPEATENHGSGGVTSEPSLAGLDPEGIPAVVGAVLVSIAAGAALWLWWRRPFVLILTILLAAAFTVLDAREVVHQVAVAKPLVALLTVGVTIFHVATAVCLILLIRAVSTAATQGRL
jgi:hypothetical protein